MTSKLRLGELLVEKKLISQDVIDQALRAQVGGNRRLGHILVRMKAITADELAEALAGQLDIPICDIAGKFSTKVCGIIPRYLCRQYDVLPLSEKDNNILELAMANPADMEAIRDLESYTGKVIVPFLALQSDIDREIPKRIPLGMKDFFSPRSNTLFTRIGVAVCLVLIVLFGGFTYRYIQYTTHGTVSVSAESTIYKNNDLMLGFDNTGKINLLGRGAFASGYYSVIFNDQDTMSGFLKSKQADLSDTQKNWIDWVMAKQLTKNSPSAIDGK